MQDLKTSGENSYSLALEIMVNAQIWIMLLYFNMIACMHKKL